MAATRNGMVITAAMASRQFFTTIITATAITVRLMRYFSERYSQFEIQDSLFTRLADPVMAEYLKGRITYDIVEEHVKSEEQKWIRKAKRFLLYEDSPCRIK